MIISSILFLIFLFFFVYLPGIAVVLGLFKIHVKDTVADIGLSLTFGLSFLILLMAIFQYFQFPATIIFIIPFFSLLILIKFKKNIVFNSFDKKSVLIILLLFAFSLIQSFPLLRGGQMTSSGLWFPSVHDNLWNISIINELIKDFPPQHPAISGEVLKNHHYLYLYFLALVSQAVKVNIYDLYFRLGPVFVSFLFGSSLYLVSSIFTNKLFYRLLSVILGVFSGNFAYLVPLFTKSVNDWRGNIFFADQPFDQIFNPYTVLGFSVFLISLYSLSQFVKNKNMSLPWLVLTAVLIGISYGIKSFGGVILIISLTVFSFLAWILFHQKKLLWLWFASILVFLVVFFLISNPGTVSLIFYPGWVLREMMIGKDKLNLPKFADVENFYLGSGNALGLLKVKIIELSIYLIGNLGVRLLGFLFLFKVLLQKKHPVFLKIISLYILILTTVALTIPLLFNLSGSPFNIVQFTPFGLILLSLATALFLESYNLPKTIILLVVLLSLPVNVKNFLSKFDDSGDVIDKREVVALDYISKKGRNDGLVLIDPQQFDKSPIYIPALANKRVFLAEPSFAKQTGFDPQYKLAELKWFLSHSLTDYDFLKKNRIAYVYLLKDGSESLFDQNAALFDNIYRVALENDRVLLLETKL